MDHSCARAIYEDIRNVPYQVSTKPGVPAANCYFKGMRLIEKLSQLGYPVKACVGEMDWTKGPIPEEITALRPVDYPPEQHFWVSIEIDGVWRMIDPSIDPITAELGFRMVDFDGDARTCFHLTRVYSQKEQIENLQAILQPGFFEDYFEKNGAFLHAVNHWLNEKRKI